MAREKTGLGKGLGALIPSEPKQQDRSYFTETTGYQEIPIGSISVNPYNLAIFLKKRPLIVCRCRYAKWEFFNLC